MTFYVRFTNEYIEDGFDGDGLPIEIWEVTATPLSAESAASQRGTLRVDVSSMTYVPDDQGWSRDIAFHGPKPPVPYSGGEYDDPNASGVEKVQSRVVLGPDEEFPSEEFEINFPFDSGWPFEYRRGGFILEYEAEAELIYQIDGPMPRAWLLAFADGRVILMFGSYVSTGIGMTSFKVYTPGDGAPAEPFWTDLLGCTELT